MPERRRQETSAQRRVTWKAMLVVAGLVAGLAPGAAPAQQSPATKAIADMDLVKPGPGTQAKVKALIGEVLEPEALMDLDPRMSKLIRARQPVTRFSVTNPEVVDVVQFSPMEFELIGGQPGETTLTLWFGEQALRYLVRVARNRGPEDRIAVEYGELQKRVNEMFPNSMVQLIPIADKLIVRGQARDSEEATQILAVIGGQAVNQAGQQIGPGSGMVALGTAARPSPSATDLPASNLINLMDVPGEQQVMLKVRVAELTRTALRQMGVDFRATAGDFTLNSFLGVTSAFSAVLNTDDVYLAIKALSSNTYSKILAEPNLVTLNGRPASFIAGGEFAVPTVVGVQGVAAASTSFRGFGTQLTFTPTIIDKDRIRLEVTPSFSSLNEDVTVNGIPGLNSRAAITTVELREGQWLAIAGLLQDQQAGSKVRVPILGDIPVLDLVFSQRTVRREETELVVLVSPEIVHPMENEQAPLVLPGMEVTEPTDWGFFLFGRYEGRSDCEHRSTVWPVQQANVVDAKVRAMHDAKQQTQYQRSEKYYLFGPHGLSR
jgi:pilus assembly protein CpaC